jgi:hypothetical protein
MEGKSKQQSSNSGDNHLASEISPGGVTQHLLQRDTWDAVERDVLFAIDYHLKAYGRIGQLPNFTKA